MKETITTIGRKVVKEGYVAITPTLCQGDTIAWSEETDDEEPIPWVFKTEDDVWKEIAEMMITELQQFIDGERDKEDVSWNGPEDYVARYVEYDNGDIEVSDIEFGHRIIQTTLEEWRASR